MPLIDVAGARIYYEIHVPEGVGMELPSVPVITLINGHTRSSTDFRMMARFLTDHGFRVVLIDNRGSGKSPATRDFDLNDMVSDVVAVWRAESVAKSHVLGISMGGMIAQWLAIHHSDAIDRLILVSTCPSRDFIRDHGSYEWPRDELAIQNKLANYFSQMFLEKNRALVAAMAKQMAKAATDGSFLVDAKRQMGAMVGFDALPLLDQITAKTLVIHGELDQIVPPEASIYFEQAISDSKRILINGAGHLLLAECPRQLYEIVVKFLQSK